MFDGTSSCWRPSYNWSVDVEPRLVTAQFGDGYVQRVIDGINPNKYTWNLNFNGRRDSVITAMLSYLAGLKGVSFPFKDPISGNVLPVFCDKWSAQIAIRKADGSWIGNLTAVFYSANDGQGLTWP
jgi:phage-related protein